MINILYLVSTLERSGPTNQLKNIIAHLDSGKFSATVLTLSPEPKDSAWEDFEIMAARLKSVGAGRIRGLWEVSRYLQKFVAHESPDIVHSQGVRPDVFSSYFLRDQTRISTLRNYPFYDYPKAFGPIIGRIVARLQIHSLRRLEQTVACSNTVQELTTQHSISLNVIRNGVDVNQYYSVSNDIKHRRRQKLQLPHKDPVFVSVGALSTRKDPITVVRGFQKSTVSENGTLVFLGDGDKLEELERFAIGNDSIRLEGFVNNVPMYLQAADYFISASTAEGLPNTVMEALACGLPVCLSSIGPHKEILELGDKVGTTFQCREDGELAIALDRLFSMNREMLADNARTLAAERLSAERTSQKYQNLYLDAIKSPKSLEPR